VPGERSSISNMGDPYHAAPRFEQNPRGQNGGPGFSIREQAAGRLSRDDSGAVA
jgi:hypothetical protein